MLFDASGSTDDQGVTSYRWDMDGDGTFELSGGATQARVFHTPGRHTVRVKVADAHGVTSTAQTAVQIDVANRPPVVQLAAGASSAPAGVTVSFSAVASDPDGGPLSFRWDRDGDGSFEHVAGNQLAVSFTSAGAHTVRVQVTDPDGAAATAAATVIVHAGDHGSSDEGQDGNDDEAGKLELSLKTTDTRQLRSTVLRKGVLARVTLNDAGRVKITGQISAASAHRLGISKARRGWVTVAPARTVTFRHADTRSVRLRLTKTARRAAARRTVTIKLTARETSHGTTSSAAVQVRRRLSKTHHRQAAANLKAARRPVAPRN